MASDYADNGDYANNNDYANGGSTPSTYRPRRKGGPRKARRPVVRRASG